MPYGRLARGVGQPQFKGQPRSTERHDWHPGGLRNRVALLSIERNQQLIWLKRSRSHVLLMDNMPGRVSYAVGLWVGRR